MKNKKTNRFKKTILVSALLLELGICTTQAATINVDGTTCTLADAITSANGDVVTGGCDAGVGDDVLELTVNGTFTLTDALPDITTGIVINGNESSISRDAGAATDFRIFRVDTGSLELNNSTISGGIAPGGGNFGGGIRVYDGTLNINDSTISGNTGGAVVFTRATSSSIINSVIDGNDGIVANFYGGGVSIAASQVFISNSTISNNTTQSNFAGGGGVYVTNYGGNSGVLIEKTTISGNSSTLRGGGISHLQYGNTTTLIIENSTLSGNTSDAEGGGLSIDATVTGTLTNLTVTGNSAGTTGGGVDISGSTTSLVQSLVSGNTATGVGPEINLTGGTLNVNDTNLFGFNSMSGLVGVVAGAGDIVPSVPLAEILNTTLALNGGVTTTHALVDGSPAIDALVATTAADCATPEDQIGTPRGNDGDDDAAGGCDIGALEHIFVVPSDIIFKNGFE